MCTSCAHTSAIAAFLPVNSHFKGASVHTFPLTATKRGACFALPFRSALKHNSGSQVYPITDIQKYSLMGVRSIKL